MKTYFLLLASLALILFTAACQTDRVETVAAARAYMTDLLATGFQLERTGAATVNDNQVTYANHFTQDGLAEIGVDWVAGQDVLTIENGQVVRDVWTIDPASETALNEGMLRATVMDYTQASNNHDLQRVRELVTDDVERITIGDPFFHDEIKGEDAVISRLIAEMANNFVVEHPEGLDGMQVQGNTVVSSVRFGLDMFREMGVEWLYATSEVTITNGEISRHVVTLSEESLAELTAATEANE